ncbi:MAG TPA: sugar phosphate nucleotidyltransferase [Anaerolineales bacterium]|nr:sugar phosphate nucleotidyltransferase [Anaerolineales bacterium]
MSSSTLKIVIPMAGYGVRLRPHTWSRPKQLIRMADKLVIDHVLDTFSNLPNLDQAEFVFIVGYLGGQIIEYISHAHPELKIHYVEQTEMRGQSHAIYLAKEYLDGPMVMIYGDTLIRTDFSFLPTETSGAVTWVKAVSDPRRFGVASLGRDGWVTHLVEKPQDMDNNLVLVGCYYFQDSAALLTAIEEQMRRNIALKNEFFLADAVNIMLEHDLKMRVQRVDIWLDAGTPEDVISTNRYLLDHGHDNSVEASAKHTSVILPPVFIHPNATVENSVIGPYTSIGDHCIIQSSIIRDSIVDDGSQVENEILEHSLIGREVRIKGHPGVMNIGDHAELAG